MKVYVSDELKTLIKREGQPSVQFYLTYCDSYYMIIGESFCITLRGNAVAEIPMSDLESVARSLHHTLTRNDFVNLKAYVQPHGSGYIKGEECLKYITDDSFEIAETKIIFNAIATALTDNNVKFQLPVITCDTGVIYTTPPRVFTVGEYVHYNASRKKIVIHKELLSTALTLTEVPTKKIGNGHNVSAFKESIEWTQGCTLLLENFKLDEQQPCKRLWVEQKGFGSNFIFTVEAEPYTGRFTSDFTSEPIKPLDSVGGSLELPLSYSQNLFSISENLPPLKFIVHGLITELTRLVHLTNPDKTADQVVRTLRDQMNLPLLEEEMNSFISINPFSQDNKEIARVPYLDDLVGALSVTYPSTGEELQSDINHELEIGLYEDKKKSVISRAKLFDVDFNDLLNKLGVKSVNLTDCSLISTIIYAIYSGYDPILIPRDKARGIIKEESVEFLNLMEEFNDLTDSNYNLNAYDILSASNSNALLREKIKYSDDGYFTGLL